ncbi:MAG TPA: hypothetical protein O0X39_02550 [Methanocorpusculum sp.]|nr:hypothetical protein [Methanocorpusculum sp.]
MTDEIMMAKRRNGVTAVAYFLLAVLAAFFTIGAACNLPPVPVLLLGFEILVGICGIILLILEKRDLTATVMLMFALLFGYYTVTGGVIYSVGTPVILIFFIICAVMMLLTGEKKASTYFCVFLPYGIGAVGIAVSGQISIVTLIMHTLFGIVALLYAVMLLMPGAKMKMAATLQSDENFSFKKSASVLGYVVLMVPLGVIAVSSVITLAELADIRAMLVVAAVSMALSGFLLYYFSKDSYKAAFYLLCAVIFGACALINTSLLIVPGACLIFIGILFLLLKDGRILHFLLLALPGVLIILHHFGLQTPALSLLLAGIPCLTAVYLALTYFCQKKQLPRF